MLGNYGRFIENFTHERGGAMIDKAHASLIFSTIISSKPNAILELGVGTGLVSWSLRAATIYNGCGTVTCVDSWVDWDGKRPPFTNGMEEHGFNIITSGEEEFVTSCQDKYDLIVVDGDHTNGHKWAKKTLGLLNPGGILFAHDICLFPNLGVYEAIAKAEGYSYKIYNKSSRLDERCDRGFIVIYV